MGLYKDKMSLTNLEKKINSELTTKINSSRINHEQLEIQIDKESLLDVIIFLKKNDSTKFRQLIDITAVDYIGSENANIISFTRLKVGEGIEVETKDFADEVAEQLK